MPDHRSAAAVTVLILASGGLLALQALDNQPASSPPASVAITAPPVQSQFSLVAAPSASAPSPGHSGPGLARADQPERKPQFFDTPKGRYEWWHPCDLDRDGLVDVSDVVVFQQRLAQADSSADLDGDFRFTVLDFAAFLRLMREKQWEALPTFC